MFLESDIIIRRLGYLYWLKNNNEKSALHLLTNLGWGAKKSLEPLQYMNYVNNDKNKTRGYGTMLQLHYQCYRKLRKLLMKNVVYI